MGILNDHAKKALFEVTLKVLARPQTVVTLEHNQTVEQALKMLSMHRILSAPMVITPGLEDIESSGVAAEPAGPQLIGWIDIRDIVQALLKHIRDKHNKLPTSMLLLMTELEQDSKAFIHRTLISLRGSEDKELVYEAEAGTGLMDVITSGFLNNQGSGRVVHRLALFDSYGTITHVISQLDVIRYLATHEEILGAEALATPISDLGILQGHAPVVCVDPHTPTLLALDAIISAGVSAAAVTDAKTGAMVANLSVSELKTIQPDHLSVLALPVAEFLALLHNTSYLGYSQDMSKHTGHAFFATGPRSPPPTATPVHAAGHAGDDVRLISCSRTSPLRDVLRLLSDNRVHRVYVIDPEAKPQAVAVITPTDILRWVAAA